MSTDPAEVPKRVILQVAIDPTKTSVRTTVAANWVFPGEKLRVGRSGHRADLVFEQDSAMSKEHFEIQFDGEECRLLDLGSSNGTRVNGKPVETSCVIKDGDELCAGNTIFRVGIMGDEEASEPLQPTQSLPRQPKTRGLQGDDATMLVHRDELPDTEGASGGLPGVATLRLKTESVSDVQAARMTRVLAWVRPGQSVVLGSSGFDSDWCVPDEWEVAPRHFRIFYDGDSCTICNCKAGVATSVNGKPIGESEVIVRDGDEIQAGSALFAVQLLKRS